MQNRVFQLSLLFSLLIAGCSKDSANSGQTLNPTLILEGNYYTKVPLTSAGNDTLTLVQAGQGATWSDAVYSFNTDSTYNIKGEVWSSLLPSGPGRYEYNEILQLVNFYPDPILSGGNWLYDYWWEIKSFTDTSVTVDFKTYFKYEPFVGKVEVREKILYKR